MTPNLKIDHAVSINLTFHHYLCATFCSFVQANELSVSSNSLKFDETKIKIVKNLLKYIYKVKGFPCPRNNSPSEENLVES